MADCLYWVRSRCALCPICISLTSRGRASPCSPTPAAGLPAPAELPLAEHCCGGCCRVLAASVPTVAEGVPTAADADPTAAEAGPATADAGPTAADAGPTAGGAGPAAADALLTAAG